MAAAVGWIVAWLGLALGFVLALIPGVPGAALALLGLVACAALTGWEVVTPQALLLATLMAGCGGVAQAVAPVWGVRAVSQASGAATGAAVGASLGLLAPLPLFGLVLGVLCAAGGAWLGRAPLVSRPAALLTLVPAVAVAVTVDLLAVLGVAAVLGVSAFLATP